MSLDATRSDCEPILERGFVTQRPGPSRSAEWRTTEVAVLRSAYPSGGAVAVRAHLPHRSLNSIRAKASALRIKCLRGSTTGLRFGPRRYAQSDYIDNVVREGYMHATEKGAVKAIASRIGRPSWWVQKRASQLGLARCNRTRVDSWKDAELALLEQWATCQPKVIATKFRQAGFARTETAINVKMKRMKIDREDPNRWNATSLAPLLGVNPATVADWVERRGLTATREGGGKGRLMIDRKRLRAWISEHSRYIDLRRVDQPWFMDLVFGK